MDVRIEATAATVSAQMIDTVVSAVQTFIQKALSLVEAVASFSCPSIGGTSLSAVSPDSHFMKGQAVAVA